MRTGGAVTSIQPFSMNSEHWLLVADVAGRITTLKVDPANPIQATFGAFNDSKTQQTRIVLMFV